MIQFFVLRVSFGFGFSRFGVWSVAEDRDVRGIWQIGVSGQGRARLAGGVVEECDGGARWRLEEDRRRRRKRERRRGERKAKARGVGVSVRATRSEADDMPRRRKCYWIGCCCWCCELMLAGRTSRVARVSIWRLV